MRRLRARVSVGSIQNKPSSRAARPENEFLRQLIAERAPYVSADSYVETLGYHPLREVERQFLELFFEAAAVLPITEAVLDEAVRLRQQQRMTLGDALVRST